MIRRLQSELMASEDQVKTSLKRQLKQEKEIERLRGAY